MHNLKFMYIVHVYKDNVVQYVPDELVVGKELVYKLLYTSSGVQGRRIPRELYSQVQNIKQKHRIKLKITKY